MIVSSRNIVFKLAAIAAVSALSVQAQVIYKHVQKDGTVLYTDQPIPGAIELNLSDVNSAVMPPLVSTPSQLIDKNSQQQNYKIEVVAPSPEATIRDNNGRLAITARLSPPATGQFNLWLNNQRVASQDSGSFLLEDLNRGAHSFYLTVTDNTGKTLASSEQQTFYMHQASVLINANP